MYNKKQIELDDYEKKIVRELIKNPRISDNQIGRETGIPVMTVNRKRKALEKKGVLHYYTALYTGEEGLGLFHARQMYVIKFKIGITEEQYLQAMEDDNEHEMEFAEYIGASYLGEKDGHLVQMIIIDAHTEGELIEVFHGTIVPALKETLGQDAIVSVQTTRLNIRTRIHHNYLPNKNIEHGTIKEEWPDDYIFVS